MEFGLSEARVRSVGKTTRETLIYGTLSKNSVHFPGAVNSKFTTTLSFEQPSTHPAIPTYRVMDSDGIIVDKDRELSDVTDEEVLTWYRNMLTGMSFPGQTTSCKG